jgi:acetyl esterase/lipase
MSSQVDKFNMTIYSLTAFLLLVFGVVTTVWAADADATQLDITYKTTAQGPLKLDLHYPAKRDAVYPLVLFTHGGGWTAGDKRIGDRGVRYIGVKALTDAGFCVASVDYRLWTKDGDVVIRDCVTDAKDGLRFLAKNAVKFSIDPNRVFTFGDSAGGQLAQMLLLSPPESFPGQPELADAKFQLIAGVSWYGPCDFEKTELFTPPGASAVQDRFGLRIVPKAKDEKERLAAYREVSPVNYLSAKSLPLLMIQGDQDTTIPVQHAYYMKERADWLKAQVEIFVIPGCGHNWRESDAKLSPKVDEIAGKTAAFMKQYLVKASTTE